MPKNIKSVVDFIEWHLNISSNNKRYAFRGHSDSNFSLIPKIARKILEKTVVSVNEETLGKREKILNTSLSVRLPAYGYDFTHLNEKQALWNKYIIAQHYGTPTRLLDFTRNPLVALFFCVEDELKCTEGEVIAVKYSDCEPLNNANTIEKVYTYPPDNIEHSFFLRPPQIDQRIQYQQSVFCCLSDPRTPLDQESEPFGVKDKTGLFHRCLIKNKDKIKEELNLIGINHAILFPDLYGYSEFVSWKINQL